MLLFSLLALLVAVVVIVSLSGGSADGQETILPEPNAARRTNVLLSGIPQHGAVLGYRKAPVMLQFFGDLQCKESRQVMLGALPFLIRRFVRAAKLQIRFRSLETDTRGAGGQPEFLRQQAAALAAGEQGKLWHFIDVFYRDQGPEYTGYASGEFLREIAREAGLYPQEWLEDLAESQPLVLQIDADEALAKAKGLNSTPSFLIGPTGGQARPLLHFGLDEPGVFEEAVEGLL